MQVSIPFPIQLRYAVSPQLSDNEYIPKLVE